MSALSALQVRILRFLQEFLVEKEFPPTIREILKGCEISSTSVVDYNLRALELKGYITRPPGLSRMIKFVNAPRQVAMIYNDDEAELVRKYLGNDPRRTVLEMCQKAAGRR